MDAYFEGLWLVRWLFQRGLAIIYLFAFLSALNQFRALLGERGLLPVPRWLALTTFRQSPTLFHWRYSDRMFAWVAWLGIVLSALAVVGFSDAGPVWLSMLVWLVLWALYLSIVNVGQTFYAFGWESMLLEAGFLAAFLGPTHVEPSAIPILALRWMLFRTELGAGLIKLRHDPCWRDLTCLYYHHETQPLPNPLSWYAHRLPRVVHRGGVVFSHFVQIVAPFGLFFPQPVAAIAGGLIIVHQLLLIITGNYAWLNWLTVVLGITAFSDSLLAHVVPLAPIELAARTTAHEVALYGFAIAIVALSIQPALNLVSSAQKMNFSYNPIHLVNAYGAFGSVTRERLEIVLEGTHDSSGDEWREYEFRGKPGDPRRPAPVVAPYHLRLDWLMWFLPFSVAVRGGRVLVRGYEPWFLRLVAKLLANDPATTRLLARDPFPERPPLFIRARLYRYHFTDRAERRATGAWWRRELLGEYLPALAREDLPADVVDDEDSRSARQ